MKLSPRSWTPTERDRLAALEPRVAVLEALRAVGPRDEQDRALLHALAATTGGQPFTCRALLRQARVVPDLQHALDEADVQSPRELGTLLRRLQHVACDDLQLQRLEETGAGRRWRVLVDVTGTAAP